MGLYQYTMRKDTIEVDGLTIGRFSYAYKLGSDWQPGGETSQYILDPKTGYHRRKMNTTVVRLEAAAERARDALPNVECFVQCDSFKDAAQYDLPVFKVGTSVEQVLDCFEASELIGHIRKIGRKFVFIAGKEFQ